MKNKYNISFLIIISFLFSSCYLVKVEKNDLDITLQPKHKESLLSKNPESLNQKDKRVLVTIHGFSGTPYENEKTINFIKSKKDNFIVSKILLGKHGDIRLFRNSTWQDWQKPIEEELDFLEKNNFKEVNIVANSTGATLLMELLNRKNHSNISKIVLVAPIVFPADKKMNLSPFFYYTGLIKAISNDLDELQIGNWFRELPASSLYQLHLLTEHIQKNINEGLKISKNIKIFVIQSKNDKVVDPISLEWWKKGLKNHSLETLVVDSKYHLVVIDRPKNDESELTNLVLEKINSFIN
ncbi:MAG: hypothetical protein U0457_17765 [Candidatus Sericytochromatia bacterium]